MKYLLTVLRPLGAQLKLRLTIAALRAWLKLVRRDRRAALALMSHAAASGDHAALRAACNALLASNGSDSALLEQLANTCMRASDPELARELYARLARLGGDPLEPRLYRNAYMDPVRAARMEPYVHTLHDVVLDTERCAIFDGDRVYIRETSGTNLENHPALKVRATPGRTAFVISRPAPTATIEEPFVLIGTDGANFGHWLSRNVLKLALLEQAGISSALPLLVNEDLRGYQTDLFDLLQIPQSRLMRVRRGLLFQCREITVPIQLRNHPRMRMAIDWLRARLACFIEPAGQAGDLIYVSRRDSKNHILLNEVELEEMLERRGFRTVVLSGMPFAEQVRAFSRAKVIVGAVGAGLANLMFAPPQAAVVEITNTNLRHMGEFREICDQMGMQYVEILSDHFAAGQSARFAPYHDFYVDLQAVAAGLRKAGGGSSAFS